MKKDNRPRMALREFNGPGHKKGDLDDVVVKPVSMFRSEFMSEDEIWMACYFPGRKDRISFCITGENLRMTATEMPDEWVDIDGDDYERSPEEEMLSELYSAATHALVNGMKSVEKILRKEIDRREGEIQAKEQES